MQEQSAEYRTALKAMPDHEFYALLVAERQKETEELQAGAEAAEADRFYNKKTAEADYDHWSKATYWTLEEAIALSFGKAPEVVHWKALESCRAISPFVRQYARIRDLAQRAVSWEKLFDPVLPMIFVNWARDNDINFPETLAEKVAARSSNWIDWRKAFEDSGEVIAQTKAAHRERDEVWTKTIMDQRTAIQAHEARIKDLIEELEQARRQAKTASEISAKKMSSIEREGMLKVIYALAVHGYRYDPNPPGGTAVPEIVSDLALEGLPLSDDTVRRYLAAACDLLPNWLEEKT